ncbi:hypothetical protein B0H14DRAFT_1223022 [Mycena olivaceomarginata]|nr:hypothetical protein B0H14DRAFT_1223022 [Mycena olivaceomarginata]
MPPQASESHTVNHYISGGIGGDGGTGGLQGGRGGAGEGPRLANDIKTENFTMNNHIQIHGSGPEQQQQMNSVERTQIINWLSPINFFLRQADIAQARQHGTGGWLLTDPHFQEWESSSGGTLWCRGIPGAGKTVLINGC